MATHRAARAHSVRRGERCGDGQMFGVRHRQSARRREQHASHAFKMGARRRQRVDGELQRERAGDQLMKGVVEFIEGRAVLRPRGDRLKRCV